MKWESKREHIFINEWERLQSIFNIYIYKIFVTLSIKYSLLDNVSH